MNEKEVLSALQRMRDSSKQRKFVQSVELMINFRNLDFKKAENQVDVRVNLPHGTGKAEGKVLLFAKDKNFISEAKDKVGKIIEESQISSLGKKEVQEIIDEFDVLFAEGPVMLTVAKFLGQQLAPKGKMPKPVQPSISSLEASAKKAATATRVTNKKGKFMPVVQVVVGKEDMSDKELAENIIAVYEAVLNVLPGKKQNIKNVCIKETMGPIVKIGPKAEKETVEKALAEKPKEPVEKPAEKNVVKEEKGEQK